MQKWRQRIRLTSCRFIAIAVGVIAPEEDTGFVAVQNLSIESRSGGRAGVSEIFAIELVVLAVHHDAIERVLSEHVHVIQSSTQETCLSRIA